MRKSKQKAVHFKVKSFAGRHLVDTGAARQKKKALGPLRRSGPRASPGRHLVDIARALLPI